MDIQPKAHHDDRPAQVLQIKLEPPPHFPPLQRGVFIMPQKEFDRFGYMMYNAERKYF